MKWIRINVAHPVKEQLVNKLFISYRRDDSVGHSGRLADRLALEFGEDQVFRDYDDIKPGQNFVNSIENGLSSADLLLVIIGENWLKVKDPKGQRRLDDKNDFVRQEIETALIRGIHIIPVLIGTTMPNSEELPPSLSALAMHQAVTLSDSRWEQDVVNLIKSINQLVGLKPSPAGRRIPWRLRLYWSITICALIAVLISIFLKQTAFSGQWYFDGGDYLAINQQGQQFNIEHIDPAMQKVYERGSGEIHGLTLDFTLESVYTDRFKYQGSLKKSWNGQSLQGELLEIYSDQRSKLLLKKHTEK